MLFQNMKPHHLFFTLLIFIVNTVEALDAHTDKQALLSFKSGITNDLENVLSSWNASSSHCTWFGISCTLNSQRVMSIDLPGLSLSGTLSSNLSNLTALKTLDLRNNSFFGQIPPEIGRLRKLKFFIIAINSISGTIPSTLSRCSNLREISFGFNELTGHLPPELGSLKRLTFLHVSANNLTGVIPSTFGNLSSLSTLSLARNKLFGSIPNEIGHLKKLVKLQLSDNEFSGDFPKSIFNISSLVYLSVAVNKLYGELPSNIASTLFNIEQLYLGENNFGGQIPGQFSNLTKLQFVDLSSNYFEGTLPLFWNMNRLVYFNLGVNNFNSTTMLNLKFFESLRNSSQLKALNLYSNQLSGELPIGLANLSRSITHFCIDDNSFTGSFPNGMEIFPNLIALSIEENQFTGQIPLSIGSLTNLQRLSLHSNLFSGQIPDIFANLTDLFKLSLGMNQFSGEIPSSIGNCQQLTSLFLSGSNLTSSVPKEIFHLVNLNLLDLSQNNFYGSFSIGNMKRLDILDISENHFSGSLPENFDKLSSITYFNVSRNNFLGLIPKSLGNLVGLEFLDLSSNNFSGPIPSDLENLKMLKFLDLSFNNLEDKVPINGVFRDLEWNSTQGNYKLCGSDREFATRLRIPLCVIDENKPTMKQNSSPKNVILVVTLTISVSIILCLVFVFFFCKRKMKTRKQGQVGSSAIIKGLPPMISYTDIQLATNGFSDENLIGKGSFGSVYKGVFGTDDDGVLTTLAIKVIDLKQNKASKTFDVECEALKNIRHRNIVKVVTSCSSIDHKGEGFKAIVMEFVKNGSLDEWLHTNEAQISTSLNIEQRLNVAIDVASALDYLHHDCEPPIVHCDLKPLNILLDEEMGAHVVDFGLARFFLPNSGGNMSSTMGLKGSIGYICPEYGLGSNVSTKGDVYSFGIILLELITGKRPTDDMFKDGIYLNNFVSAQNLNHVMSTIDSGLIETSFSTDDYSINIGSVESEMITDHRRKMEACIEKMVSIGLSCTCDSAFDRITMRDVLTKLHEIRKVCAW